MSELTPQEVKEISEQIDNVVIRVNDRLDKEMDSEYHKDVKASLLLITESVKSAIGKVPPGVFAVTMMAFGTTLLRNSIKPREVDEFIADEVVVGSATRH